MSTRESHQTFLSENFSIFNDRLTNQLLLHQSLMRVTLKCHMFARSSQFSKCAGGDMKFRSIAGARVCFKIDFTFGNRPCKMKGGAGVSLILSFGRSTASRLNPAWRAPRRKTADLYFFVWGAAGRLVHKPGAVCVPYTGCTLCDSIRKKSVCFKAGLFQRKLKESPCCSAIEKYNNQQDVTTQWVKIPAILQLKSVFF